NNNPEGHNQYDSGWVSSARENPLTTAAAVGGAVAAGVFLWSRRNQISDQIGNLSDQISEWRDSYGSQSDFGTDEATASENFMAGTAPGESRKQTQAGISAKAVTLKDTGRGRQPEPIGSSYPRMRSRGASAPLFLWLEKVGDYLGELRLGDRTHMRSRDL